MLLYTATQARANFFKLLDHVEAGQQVIIAKLDDRTLFRVSRLDDKGTGNSKVARKPATRHSLSYQPDQTHWEDHDGS